MFEDTKIKDVYDRLYEAIKHYINNASKDTLAEHYDWYGVDVGDTEGLINTMYESYCGNYDEAELENRIVDLEEYDKNTDYDRITEDIILTEIENINNKLQYLNDRDEVCCSLDVYDERYELEEKLQELEKKLEQI